MAAHGYFDYGRISEVADDIEREFMMRGKYRIEGEEKLFDRLEGTNDGQRENILTKVDLLLTDLRYCAKKVRDLEWFLSGEMDADKFIKITDNLNLTFSP